MANTILDKIRTSDNVEELLTVEFDSELLLQLSHMRKNLIEWIDFEKNESVLEIGAGCGTITEMLAQRVKRVVAVEADPDYMEVNQYRNRKWDNLVFAKKTDDVQEKFDTIVLIGLSECSLRLQASPKELIAFAMKHLKENGRLILAMDNKYGLKFWAGAKNPNTDQNFDTISGRTRELSLSEAYKLLEEQGSKTIDCYYPSEDYRLPIEIFSEKYPIKEGSITGNTRAYASTRYQLFEEPLVADELCRDGMFSQFANSYLFLVNGRSRDVLYTKYNSIRSPKFQLRTSIKETDGVRYVEKAPMVEAAYEHAMQMPENRRLLQKVYSDIRLVDCEKTQAGLKFSFVKGKPIVRFSEEKVSGISGLVEQINLAFDVIFKMDPENLVPFVMTEEFRKMYPDCRPEDGCEAYAVSNLDSILSNFVITESGEVFCLDYEWVANFPVPVNYVKYRSLLYIFHENQGIFAPLTTREQLLCLFGIEGDELLLYDRMEYQFQQYVHGKNLKYNYLQFYEKPSIRWEELKPEGMQEKLDEYAGIIKEKDVHIGNLEHINESKDKLILEKEKELESVKADTTDAHNLLQAQNDYIEKIKYYKRRPVQAVWDKVSSRLWAKKNNPWASMSPEQIASIRAEQRKKFDGRDFAYENMMEYLETLDTAEEVFSYQPLISILVPVYNVADEYLIACIESVRSQTYKNWELCIADDCSTQKSVRAVLERYENTEKVKICYRTENGHISKCTNSALEMATGEFVGFLDCDDLLSPNALYEIVKALNENPKLDFIYSDEDKIRADGSGRHNPHFKPDWSPDTLMSFMYTSHFSVYRTSITRELGGLRTECDGAQDYDFTLRFTEKTSNIGHVAKVLYHWREIEGSTSGSIEAKPYVYAAQKKAKEDALARRGLQGVLTQEGNQLRVTYLPIGNPKVSIIIPSKDNYKILKRAIESLVAVTEYSNYEVILVDNGSSDECRRQYELLMEEARAKKPDCTFCYHYEKMQFNFSHMCNLGAELATGEYYLFLNDDIEVLYPNWLSVMVGQAQVPHSGAVGAKLYYPNSQKIQHVGIVKIEDGPSHAFCGLEDRGFYYFGRNCIDFDYIAVTGACLAVSAEKFHQVGGFEEGLPVAYNDVDLCFKLLEAGYFNVVRTDVILYHYESVSRGYDFLDKQKFERLVRERNKLYQRHPKLAERDPFYSPYLAPHRVDYTYNSDIVYNKEIQPISNAVPGFYQHLHVDQLQADEDFVFRGWIWDEKCENNNACDYIIRLEHMENDRTVEERFFDTVKIYRPDVGDCFPQRADLDFIGFSCRIKRELLADGMYYVSVISVSKKATVYRVAWPVKVYREGKDDESSLFV